MPTQAEQIALRANTHLLSDLMDKKFATAFLNYVAEKHHAAIQDNPKADKFDSFQEVLSELRSSYEYKAGAGKLSPTKSGNVKADLIESQILLRTVGGAVEMDGVNPDKLHKIIEGGLDHTLSGMVYKPGGLVVDKPNIEQRSELTSFMEVRAKDMKWRHLEAKFGPQITDAVKELNTSLGDHQEAKLLDVAISELKKVDFWERFGDEHVPDTIAKVRGTLEKSGVSFKEGDVTQIVITAKKINDGVGPKI